MGQFVWHNLHTAAKQWRCKELPHGDVEALRRGLGDHVVRPQAQVRHLAQLVVEHARLLDHHPFGLPSRARGVDHVRQVLRATVALRIVLGAARPVECFQHQQLRPPCFVQCVQQSLGLRLARLGAEQHRGAAQGDDMAQALLWQARVQWQVAGGGLEGAHHHAQQLKAALRQQCHWLVRPDPQRNQPMGHTVGTAVELAVAVLPVAAARNDRLRGTGHLRFEQLGITVLQRVIGSRLVDVLQQPFASGRGYQAERAQAAVQRQAQALLQHMLEVVRQRSQRRALQMLQRMAVVQLQGLPLADRQGQRVMRLFAAVDLAEAQACRGTLLQRFRNRVVLEDQDVVEQGLAALPAPALDVEQRGVFELAHGHVLRLQLLQELRERQLRGRAGSDRQGVDEQAHLLLDALERRRAPGNRGPERDAVLPGIALQQQQPGTLQQGVEGDLVLARQCHQLPGGGGIDHLHMLGVALPGFGLGLVGNGLRQAGGPLQVAQTVFPERFTGSGVLPAQPADVIAVAAGDRWQCRGLTVAQQGVLVQHFAQQLGVAPAIHEDVMAGIEQVLSGRTGAHQRQAQQRRLAEVEALLALVECQLLKGSLKAFAPLPVVHHERQFNVFAYHLQGLLVFPVELRAQDIVALQYSLPGTAETLDIQAVDIDAHLVHVIPRLLLVQGVEQHALLHRRQRIEVGDLGRGHWQLVQLGLRQARQREVGRRYTAHPRCAAVLDQRLQLAGVICGQALKGGAIEQFATERPAQAQLTAVHLAIEAQQVAQRRLRVVIGALVFLGRHEQRFGLIEAAIELAQVVEGDFRQRCMAQLLTRLGAAPLAQHPETDAVVGNAVQVLLDLLQGVGTLAGHRQLQREHRGEPAERAAEVQVVEQRFTAMTFQQHRHFVAPGPACNHPHQGCQQQVVDPCAVGGRRLAQQPLGPCPVQAAVNRVGVALLIGCGQVADLPTRQCGAPLQLLAPVAKLALHVRCMPLQALGPCLHGMALGGQVRLVTRKHGSVGLLQVLQQDAP
ncbi:hypothetical protein D3C76_233280 [compost metagenome]